MEFLEDLTNWVEEHFEDATSYYLEVQRDGEVNFRPYKQGKIEDIADPANAATEIYQWAQTFRANNKNCAWRAMVRVKDAEGVFTKIVKSFFLPPVSGIESGNPFALSEQDLDSNPGLKIFMQIMEGERQRTTTSLQVSKMREDTLFETIIEMKRENREDMIEERKALAMVLEEMREERTMMRTDMREERKAHDDRVGPIIEQSANALSKAAELVKIHQENNTQVQLAKLEYEADEKRMEMYAEIGIPFLKKMADKFGKKKKKKKKTEMPIDTDQEDAKPPSGGPTRELFDIFEKLEDAQLKDVERILPEGMFDRLDNAAHSGDDGQTTVALGELKVAYEKEGKLKGLKKLLDLGMVLGDELSDRFMALFEAESEPKDKPEDFIDTTVTPIRKREGYVEGLKLCGFAKLLDEQLVALGEQIGAKLTGILSDAAGGEDEVRAHGAICAFAVRLSELATKMGEDVAEDRMQAVGKITGGDMGILAELMNRAAEEM